MAGGEQIHVQPDNFFHYPAINSIGLPIMRTQAVQQDSGTVETYLEFDRDKEKHIVSYLLYVGQNSSSPFLSFDQNSRGVREGFLSVYEHEIFIVGKPGLLAIDVKFANRLAIIKSGITNAKYRFGFNGGLRIDVWIPDVEILKTSPLP